MTYQSRSASPFCLWFVHAAVSFLVLLCESNDLGNDTKTSLCNENDRQALLLFLQGIHDPMNSLYSWTSEQDCCKWKGIRCDEVTGTVIQMELDHLHLGGNIDSSILNLRGLQSLYLSYNQFSGMIPDWLGQAEQILRLDLSWNLFHGSIPSNLGNMSSLIYLHVESNFLNGSIPESIWKNSKLQELNIGNNSLTGVVSQVDLSGLSSLKTLDMRDSRTLDFEFDSQWIPPFQLRELVLRSCKLGPGFPEWLYTQKSLVILDISSAGLSFRADEKFWIWVTKISIIHLSDNSISGDMSNLMFSSEEVMIENNNFTGLVPSITSQTMYFFAGGNSFSGPISRIFCDTVFTENFLLSIELSNNQLTGELPDCWSKWPALDYVNLGGNNITGKIPASIGFLSRLRYLRLQNNRLYGEIPFELSYCNLIYLDLSGNALSGSVIPTWVKPNAFALILGSNQLSGDIPSQICQLTSLRILDLGLNKLSGQIPKCFNNISALSSTSDNSEISNGDFEKNFAILTWIWISDALKLVTKGQENNYRQNIKFLRFIDLSSNVLGGTIPPEIFSVAALVFLNLSNNNLVGKIPREVGHMEYLESLDLSKNQLFGEIPQSLSNLSFLGYLNMSYNNLSGCIPSGTQLQSFTSLSYMANPHLSGLPVSESCDVNIINTTPTSSSNGSKDEDDFFPWFYVGLGVGFAISYCAVWSTLVFKKSWRHAYFSFVENLTDQIYVFVVKK